MKYLPVIFSMLFFNVNAQDISIMSRIEALQCQHDSFYHAGQFPSQRLSAGERKTVEDNNIFFTALINYTLQKIKDSLSENDQMRADSILFKSKETYKYYRSRNGDITCNFYQIHPECPFPNTRLISKVKKFRLPDDLDDTSIIYLSLQTSDSLNEALRQKINCQSGSSKKIRSTFKKYRSSKAYRTWFAQRMKQDLDVCVMANVLLFVFEKKLELDSVATQTIDLLKRIIHEDEHLKHEHLVSTHYQSSSIILYHLARLIQRADHPELNKLRKCIIEDLYDLLEQTDNHMEQVILLTSLHRLNEQTGFSLNLDDIRRDMNSFFWFKANPFCGSSVVVKRLVGQSNFLHFKYKCEAYYWSLVLELQHISGAVFSQADTVPVLYKPNKSSACSTAKKLFN